MNLNVFNPNNSTWMFALASFFAKVIDRQSDELCKHSLQVAEKAKRMAQYYNFDELVQAKLYFAGAVHDIGKIVIASELLNKPCELSSTEYLQVQEHVMETYKILSSIDGLEDVCDWASRHHERLDGSGYPFGLTGEVLGINERIIACVDIYQALREKRVYNRSRSHREAMAILRKLAIEGKLDSEIVEDINHCFT